MSTQVYSYSELQAVILHLSQCLNPAPQPLQTGDLVSVNHSSLLAWCSSCSPRGVRGMQEGNVQN